MALWEMLQDQGRDPLDVRQCGLTKPKNEDVVRQEKLTCKTNKSLTESKKEAVVRDKSLTKAKDVQAREVRQKGLTSHPDGACPRCSGIPAIEWFQDHDCLGLLCEGCMAAVFNFLSKPANKKFSKKEYQREYMRKRRSEDG